VFCDSRGLVAPGLLFLVEINWPISLNKDSITRIEALFFTKEVISNRITSLSVGLSCFDWNLGHVERK